MRSSRLGRKMSDTFCHARPTLPFLLCCFCDVAALQGGMPTVDVESVDSRICSGYGLDNDQSANFGRKCSIAHRLLQQGVRSIQLFYGGGRMTTTGDTHRNNFERHKQYPGETERPIATCIGDLKRAGPLDETLLI